MRKSKAGVVLIAILLVALTAGCTGEKTANTFSESPTSSASPKVTLQPKHHSTEELLRNMENIKQFSYIENTSIRFNVTIRIGNSTQRENTTIIYRRSGYIDLVNKKAEINTTTTVFPGGAETFTRDIIIGDKVYIFLNGRWIKLTNDTFGPLSKFIANMTWKYNIVSFTEKYLKRKPFNETFRNGTLFLYYNITEEDLRGITSSFFGNNSNMTFNVSRGVLEIRFRNGVLIGGRMGYRMTVHTWGEAVGRMVDIYETGNVYDEFVVFDINVTKRISPPELERA